MARKENVIKYYVLCNKLKNIIRRVGKIGMLKKSI